jgi:hypothetical protein
VRVSRRAVDELARAFTIGWWTVQRALSRSALAMAASERRCVRRLASTSTASAGSGFSATRTLARGGGWSRAWCPSFDQDTGSVIGLVDGRDSAAVRGWLAARPRWWRRRCRSSLSTRRRRSARRETVVAQRERVRGPLAPDQARQRCGYKGSASVSRRSARDVAAARSTLPGRTACCCCAPMTGCPPAAGPN